jgi:hypothetical protein
VSEREPRRASVLTCDRGLQSALVSDVARLTRRWSRSLRDAKARLPWAEADLLRPPRKEHSRSRGGRRQEEVGNTPRDDRCYEPYSPK